ncbi:Type III restriction protein res subunit (fragment) [Candidatus Accumulibacter aalborgensis]|uniref:Type III restriction protein res subunit n=1 Tax=Candidatus Accumulibacter aalborgensis TaxID=1860102 RepID=A0A1A8XGU7_9PROT
MSPEEQAHLKIDDKLAQVGWAIHDMKQLNLGAAVGAAVREYPTDTGPADYALFVNRNAVGVIEAKKDSAGENITVVESQTERYATANLKWSEEKTQLRYLTSSTSCARSTATGTPSAKR